MFSASESPVFGISRLLEPARAQQWSPGYPVTVLIRLTPEYRLNKRWQFHAVIPLWSPLTSFEPGTSSFIIHASENDAVKPGLRRGPPWYCNCLPLSIPANMQQRGTAGFSADFIFKLFFLKRP